MTTLAGGTTIGRAWVDGLGKMLAAPGGRLYMLVTEITAPVTLVDEDRPLLASIDRILREADRQPLQAVSNTIFPQDLYAKYGEPLLYRHYVEEVYPIIKQDPANRWGTYVHRMMHRRGPNGDTIIPLQRLVQKMKDGVRRNVIPSSHYELSLVDPSFEIALADPTLPGTTLLRGGPCLSHLSFKVPDRRSVDLIAFYRTHYFIEKALGNFLGLARLLNFVATEAGLTVGKLTVISSCAELDIPSSTSRGNLAQLLESERALET